MKRSNISDTAHIQKELTGIRSDILITVLYFDVFSHPLTLQELFHHRGKGYSAEDFRSELNALADEGLLLIKDDFVLSPFASPENIERRKKGNLMAAQTMPDAIKWARLAFAFPFVRAVHLSGSLSKDHFDQGSDYDFFVVTKRNRLWISRAFLTTYWKLLPLSKKHKLCTNYFIDEDFKLFAEQNIFTATELSYLKPIFSTTGLPDLVKENQWIAEHVNNKPSDQGSLQTETQPRFKRIVESLFPSVLGNTIDKLIMKLTARRWRSSFPGMDEADFDLQFRVRPNVAKRHLSGFQNKVLKLLDERIMEFQERAGVTIHSTTYFVSGK